LRVAEPLDGGSPRVLRIPSLSLVVLVGASGAGKSTFARRHFKPTEVLSSDFCRGLVADDENDQSATTDAFDVLHYIAAKRLAAGRLTVVDATNVQQAARKPLVELARRYHVLPVAIVFDLPERVSQERNRGRPDRAFGPHVVRRQLQDLRRSLGGLEKEGFRYISVLRSADEVDAVRIARVPLYSHKHHERGPFDIIGDVHGCFDELVALLGQLGYAVREDAAAPFGFAVTPPDGRKAIFLGDLVDRGPKVPHVLRLVMGMVESGAALCVPGNHEVKLLKALNGRKVQISHGLAESLAQLAEEPPELAERVKTFVDGLISHYVLDDGKLVVAHAGLREEMHGRGSGRVRSFALYGDTTGETDEYGLPVRYQWAKDYRGKAMVVYGHTPVLEPQWLNNTICLDTGCVFGGRLTALRYPEKELVSVPAARVYYEPVRPLGPADTPDGARARTAQQEHDDLLDLEDVLGRRVVSTRLAGNVVIAEEQAAAALEVMSRGGAGPPRRL
jgi:protein phosphatase